ncbi:hypothetical protein STCU_02072 [Strigomonas culicis]|uniref:Uncharacterized protein n=1 Tax=Strigomonas culicis TaxID=28005 RepID=S9UY83_9TRYP|nr:hypothetical protein STCU_02072 [Strigomonas culicis]|eukprot:EPY33694.1 hypothetical protein STCU_02072 [Strigomonas culicis]
MRLSAGKIYFWGAFTIITLTVWNRHSTNGLRHVVESIKEQRMQEAENLRRYSGQTRQLTPEEVIKQKMAGQPIPQHYNPYYKQQEIENAQMEGKSS